MAVPTLADFVGSQNTSADTTPDVAYPAHSTGDLIVSVIAIDSLNNITVPSAGPNSETINTIVVDDATQNCGLGAIWWVATGDEVAGTLAWAIDGSGQDWDGFSFRVAAGDFNVSDPLEPISAAANGSGVTADMPEFGGAGVLADGRVVCVGAVDDDPMDATFSPTGWTDQYDRDGGSITSFCGARDAGTTADETIAAASFGINTTDGWHCVGFVINAAVAAGGALSVNLAGRGGLVGAGGLAGVGGGLIGVPRRGPTLPYPAPIMPAQERQSCAPW